MNVSIASRKDCRNCLGKERSPNYAVMDECLTSPRRGVPGSGSRMEAAGRDEGGTQLVSVSGSAHGIAAVTAKPASRRCEC
jgi:hypothetical protein